MPSLKKAVSGWEIDTHNELKREDLRSAFKQLVCQEQKYLEPSVSSDSAAAKFTEKLY